MTVLQTQAKLGGVGGSPSSIPGNMALSSATTAGSKIIVAISFEVPTVSAITVSDNQNGTYTLNASSGTLSGSGGNGGGLINFYSVNNTFSGTGLTISASWTTASPAFVSAYEVSGAPLFDNSATPESGTSTLTALGFTFTPNHTDFVVAVALSNNNTGIVVDTGYTFPANSNGLTLPTAINVDFHSHEYIASVSGLQSLNFNGTGSGGASMFAAAYGAGGGGGTATIAWVS
jgi:hypothetical protein